MTALLFKLLILLLLALILLSLSSGIFFLVKDQSEKNRLRNALTIRITLSVILVILLLVGYQKKWIQPHGVLPEPIVDTATTYIDRNIISHSVCKLIPARAGNYNTIAAATTIYRSHLESVSEKTP